MCLLCFLPHLLHNSRPPPQSSRVDNSIIIHADPLHQVRQRNADPRRLLNRQTACALRVRWERHVINILDATECSLVLHYSNVTCDCLLCVHGDFDDATTQCALFL